MLTWFGSLSLLTYGYGQAKNTHALKMEVVGPLWGSYNFSYEKKIWQAKHGASRSKGYYNRHPNLSGHDQPVRRPQRSHAPSKLTSDYNKMLVFSAGFENRDFSRRHTLLQGIGCGVGLKQYLMKRAPEGCYLLVGLHYQFYAARTYNQEFKLDAPVYLHRPSVTLPRVGWQQLFGRRNNYALDVFAGLNLGWLSSEPAFKLSSLQPVRFEFGAQVGFAFRTRRRFWY